MNLPDPQAVSRSASRTSGRSSKSRNSTLSRNQSLIKKNIELHDLKPADVLIERFVAWKAIVKQLTAYFEGIADIENNTAKEMAKLAGVIQVPFRAGNQFLGQGGLQDVFYDIRDKTRVIADQHADLGRTIDSSIVQHLQKLRAEIKAHIKNVQNDTGKLATGVARERELSTKLVGELANSVSTFKNTPMNIPAKADPYVANQAVHRQLSRQVLEENLLQKSIVMMQQNSAHFEEGIVKAIQSAWATFDEWQARSASSTQAIFRTLAAHLATIQPDREWIQFAARSDHLLDPDTPLRDSDVIIYPLKDDPSVIPVHRGHLERKKRFTRTWTEGYFVLTPAGFLHEFSSSDPSGPAGIHPTFSLFLPNCTLGPASSPRAKAHKFHIEGTKEGTGVTAQKSGSFKALLGGEGSKAWSFKARSREEMMEWWNDIRMLCARYLVASEAVDRTGPVEEAVRAVGYASGEETTDYEEEEEEEEEEHEVVVGQGMLGRPVHDREARAKAAARRRAAVTGVHAEDEGSSVEEEHEPEVGYEEPPLYTHPAAEAKGHYPVEIGPHGYAIDKKTSRRASHNGPYGDYTNAPPPANIAYHTQPTRGTFHEAPAIQSNEHGDVRSYRAERESGGEFAAPQGGEEGSPRMGRRLSKRQAEKARASAAESGAGIDEGEQQAEAPPPIALTRTTSPPPPQAPTTVGVATPAAEDVITPAAGDVEAEHEEADDMYASEHEAASHADEAVVSSDKLPPAIISHDMGDADTTEHGVSDVGEGEVGVGGADTEVVSKKKKKKSGKKGRGKAGEGGSAIVDTTGAEGAAMEGTAAEGAAAEAAAEAAAAEGAPEGAAVEGAPEGAAAEGAPESAPAESTVKVEEGVEGAPKPVPF